jgi:methylenetetrahydrofolate dehydrogenase (NADP+)/methenyltetrahydrofolate cyclohydrolase
MQATQELKGGEIAKNIEAEVKAELAGIIEGGIAPKMAAVFTSEDPSMLSYVRSKARAAERLGIAFEAIKVTGGQHELEDQLRKLSADKEVHGIVLELPLGDGYDFLAALRVINPLKDIDGLTPENLGLMLRGREEDGISGATALACLTILETLGPIAGKRIALIGKGKTVGRPLLPLLLNRHATVTVAHSHTKDLKNAIKDAEVVISATGVVGLLTKEIITDGQVVIDAGLTVIGKEIKGDADRASLQGVAAAITPVPDGVGPVTTALAFRNLVKAIKMQLKK